LLTSYLSLSDPKKTIAIIGAGPSGVATLKAFQDSPEVESGEWEVTAFEAREKLGGVWLASSPIADDPPLTPTYDSLITNVPHPCMGFSTQPYPPSTHIFPKAEVIQRYLESFVDNNDLRRRIVFNERIQHVERDQKKEIWKVTLSTGEVRDFDLVVVANGHYREPRWPVIPGLDEWKASGKVEHSIKYRRPDPEHKRIVVIGASASGVDTSRDYANAGTYVFNSSNGRSPMPEDSGNNVEVRDLVKEFHSDGRVEFVDGTSEDNIDFVVVATGYQLVLPFFSSDVVKTDFPSSYDPLPSTNYNTTYSLFPLARFIWPVAQSSFPPHTLAFMGLPRGIVVFPFLETQALAIYKAFKDPESLDVAKEKELIVKRVHAVEERLGSKASELDIAHDWQNFFAEQFIYRDEMYAFAGLQRRVPWWEKDIVFEGRNELKKSWVHLLNTGKADEFVKGVGTRKGKETEDWVALLQKLIEMAKTLEVEEDVLAEEPVIL